MLADDPTDATDEASPSSIIPTVVKVYFVDYQMRDSAHAETDYDHTWTCDYWYYGDLVDVPQYDVTTTPNADEPVHMVGGAACSAWVYLELPDTLSTTVDVDLTSEWGSFDGNSSLYGSPYPAGGGAFAARPNQVDDLIDQQIAWSYKVPSGSDNWIVMNTTVHDIYQSYDDPVGSPPAPRKRVQTVCNNAEDETTEEGIADGLVDWIDDALNDQLGGQISPYVDAWCYYDPNADGLECDDQARMMKLALELLGVEAYEVQVNASTDRNNVFDDEEQDCPICYQHEYLCLTDGSVPHAFAGCCLVIDDGECILYSVWDPDDGKHEKAWESEVTNNPPAGLSAAGLALLNRIGLSQAWFNIFGVNCHGQPKPPVN